MRAWVPVAVVAAGLLPGCSLVVGALTTGAPVCASSSDCLPGSACVEGVCQAAEEPGPPPVDLGEVVGPAGGTVVGDDGVRLDLPEDALTRNTGVAILRQTSTLAQAGLEVHSAVYEILPHQALQATATLTIPVSGLCPGCRVYRRGDGSEPFVAIGASTVAAGSASAPINALDFYVVAAPLAPPPPEPLDGGLDAGADPVEDAGPPATLFSACAFGPADCSAGEVCRPHPFFPGEGRCLAPAGACGPECACCGSLPDAPDGGALCLPDELCGEGAPGDPCSDGGVASCDPLGSSACATPWLEAPVCTTSCTADDEAEVCGSGCCLPDEADPARGVCSAGPCALPLGALCLTDASCASGTCASAQPDEAPRCTESCTPGSCGRDLCCFPTTCAGDGICVPEGQCEGDELWCTDLCLDDDACGGGLCFEQTCLEAGTCGCLEHEDCAADEACVLDAAQATACQNDPEGPCCGTCAALGANTCYIDAHCPQQGGPQECVPAADAGCAGDLLDPCPGTCTPLPDDGCIADDDCAPPRRCVDHACL